ncbi:mechanosensitive ion channel family protein [Rhizobium lusitanum]|uniref:mechanosensitive ion channel family protein n=1 Tax=Rhizobium lusitanum TaxID=293958 RepID=UPI001574CE0F|nr:mechanosensitive ion channel family protein [Rhizobium lusitanum]NTJ11612.1 mechanosensitive ion channel family protein [Rhizobium lusitanum]
MYRASRHRHDGKPAHASALQAKYAELSNVQRSAWLMAVVFKVLVVVVGTILLPAAAAAQTGVPAEPLVLTLRGDEVPETVRETLDTLSIAGRRIEIRIAGKDRESSATVRDGAPTTTLSSSSTGRRPNETPLNAFWNHFGDGLTAGVRSVPRLADLPQVWESAWAQNRNGATGIPAGWRIAASGILAISFAGLFRRVTASWFARRMLPKGREFTSGLVASSWVLLQDLLMLGLGLSALHVLGSLVLPEPDLARTTLYILSDCATTCIAYWILGRFLLAPGATERRLMPLPRAERHFRLLAFYAVASQALVAIMNLAQQVGGPGTFSGFFAVGAFTLMLFKVCWFFDARHDLETLILANGVMHSPSRRVIAAAAGWFYAVCFVAIWMVGNTATEMENGDQWVKAGTWTQVIIILTPILAVGVTSLMTSRQTQVAESNQTTPLAFAFGHAVGAAAGGAIWAGGFLLLARHWTGFWFDVNSERFAVLTRQMGRIAVLAFACWVALVFLRSFFDAYTPKKIASLPGDVDEAEGYTPSRLTTVMPVLRVVVLSTVLGVTTLILLAQFGVDTGPLLAGFGILGLAISFGSQALVRDIVSGLFFMLEDAFRVGEYVDTGRLKGTVEKISLRSMQLRHQSGLIHTVPFGQVQSLTNASRDWATMKFNIRLDHSTDLEQARKTIKKIGLVLLEDPEFGPHFILPLKMQGIADITETAIVVRLKFTAKPNQASILQREALKRVYRGLNEAGVAFASNAVTVKEGSRRDGVAAITSMPPSPLPSGPA